MKCRSNCGACCIAPSISSPIPGMPGGKPVGVRCIHLTEDYRCAIYDRRPKLCRDFKAEELVCGRSREEAMKILSDLEAEVGSRQAEVRNREPRTEN
jgi:Fe-S-cluster containining protein